MNKSIILGVFAILGLIAVVGFVDAHGGYGNLYRGVQSTEEFNEHHERMEEILEEGTYQDLVDYREETGMPIMPWVTNEETFQEAKERHEAMEEIHEKYGYGMNRRGFGQRGYGFGAGCPMMS